MLLSSSVFANCIKEDDDCIPIEQWQFSVALGAGVLSNPLHGGDNFPLLVIPYLSYYGENLFLENNVLGYTFEESNDLSVSLITQLNREAAFFSKWQPSQLLLPNYSGSFEDSTTAIEIDQIKSRRWAIDAGLQLNWFPSKNSHVEMQLLHDINNVYQGFNAHWAAHQSFTLNHISNSRLILTLGLNWQSKALINYYYNDESFSRLATEDSFQAKANINPYLKVDFNMPINKDWRAKISIKREFLGSNLTKSPLVKDNHIDVAYLGLVYAF